jgi:magnesium-transporting ATPase (P-type)
MSASPIHTLRISEVFENLETTPDGLTSEEALSRHFLYGENILSETRKIPVWQRISVHFLHPLALILLGAGFLAIFRDPLLSAVIWVLTLANAGLSFWREYRAEEAVGKLQQVLPTYAHLLRNGKEVHIPAREVVPGDILILAEGDNIPADARVIEEYGLRTNNATLTGESVAARKVADASHQREISELEQPNLIFAGTSVASGTGRAVIYATGMLTQFGRIAHLTQSVPEEPSPFFKELRQVVKVTSLVAIALGAAILSIGFFENNFGFTSNADLLLFALGVIVAAIPEGLPATLSLTLAMAVQRLAQKGVLVKKPSTVETLGNVSVICTDKSGTLTQNQMTVRNIWVSGQQVKVGGVGYEPNGTFNPAPDSQPWEDDFLALLEAASCCNNSRLNAPTPDHPTWHSLGDQTEVALKVAAMKADIQEQKMGLTYPRIHEIPFDARRKRMTTIHREKDGEIAFVKGAPREILQLCSHIQVNRERVPLEHAMRARIMAANDSYARNALRVLAVARRDLDLKSNPYTAENVERDLTFLGLMGMMDPPRPEVEQAIHTCREAGIRIVMITGDYGLTAESLARRVGMISGGSARLVTGSELDEMSEVELNKVLEGEVIFARMAPEHKLRLVAAFQARGDVVAVTGDGVNDAPALRKADVGVAMGIVGTDVAKESADIILTNDNFGAIASAIEEGRSVYNNIRKFITYIFSSNVPEIMPFLVSASFPGVPLALNVRQILAIDLGTDLLPAMALGMEKPEPNVMKRPPRKRNQRLIDNGLLARAFLWLGMIEAALCFVGFFSVYLFSGNAWQLAALPWLESLPFPRFFFLAVPLQHVKTAAITVYHAGVAMAQVGNAFACRSETLRNSNLGWTKNPALLGAVLIEITGILVIVYVEPFKSAFQHFAIEPIYWAGLGAFGLILYSLEWLRKQAARLLTSKTPSD